MVRKKRGSFTRTASRKKTDRRRTVTSGKPAVPARRLNTRSSTVLPRKKPGTPIAMGPPEARYLAGVQGSAGPQGPTGPQGPEGLPGPAGAQGPQGAQGPAGAQGAEGAQGPAGLQGPAGSPGVPGAQGPAGPQGLAGPQGGNGPQGIAGPTGFQGPQGPVGLQGPAGAQGAEGAQGPAGLPGSSGAQGPQGPEGAQGPAGEIAGVVIFPSVFRYFYIPAADLDATVTLSAEQFTDDQGTVPAEFSGLGPNGYTHLYINGVLQQGMLYRIDNRALTLFLNEDTVLSGRPIIVENILFEARVV